MIDVNSLTAAYEHWLRGQIPVVADDLERKHAVLREHEFSFLRGTYYLWLVRYAEKLPHLIDAPRVRLVGDVHVENYGTWNDHEAVRRWGVNDLDELAGGAYPLDLVRLATSAVLTPHLHLTQQAVCEIVLHEWSTVPRAREAVDLHEKGAAHLRELVPQPAAAFYGKLARGAPAQPVPEEVRRAMLSTVPGDWQPTWHRHEAGTGSLGHPRCLAVGPTPDGKPHAREAKLLGPPTCVWAATFVDGMPERDDALYAEVMGAIRGPDPALRVGEWQLRRLAPDVVRIELAHLHRSNAERLLRAMTYALADVHGPGLGAAQKHAAGLPADWLSDAVTSMAHVIREDFHRFAKDPLPPALGSVGGGA
jgi:hypothetical protein